MAIHHQAGPFLDRQFEGREADRQLGRRTQWDSGAEIDRDRRYRPAKFTRHAYRARESIMHMLYETNLWLEKYVKNPQKPEPKKMTTDQALVVR